MSSVPQPQNDRTYTFQGRDFALFSLQHNTYCLPIDDDEEERFDELHSIISILCQDQVTLAPFPPTGVRQPEVLDCGYGGEAWIDDFLRRHPSCLVTGVDLNIGEDTANNDDDEEEGVDHSPGLREFVKKRWNLNAPFRDDHSNTRLLREQFHLINSRFLAEGINADRWPSYIGDLRRMLKPGGWLQMIELELRFQSDNGRLAPDTREPLNYWSEWYRSLMQRRNKDPRVGQQLGRMLQVEGFDLVEHRTQRLEIGEWNTDPNSAALGRRIREVVRATIESVLLWYGVWSQRWNPADITVFRLSGLVEELCRDRRQP